MVPTGSLRFVRVLSLCHLPLNKTCFGGVANVYKILVRNSEGKSLIAKSLTLKWVFKKLSRECLSWLNSARHKYNSRLLSQRY